MKLYIKFTRLNVQASVEITGRFIQTTKTLNFVET